MHGSRASRVPRHRIRSRFSRFTDLPPTVRLLLFLVAACLLAAGCGGDDKTTQPGDTASPAAVSDLAWIGRTASAVTLAWTAVGDDDSSGCAKQYDLRYTWNSEIPWESMSQFTGEPAPRTAGQPETLTVSALPPATYFCFCLKVSDEAGNWSSMSNTACTTTEAPPDTVPPAAVADLRVTSVGSDRVSLAWTAPGNNGGSGTAVRYEVRYAASPITEENWNNASSLDGEPAPHAPGAVEVFTATGLASDAQYSFAMKTSDGVSNWSGLSNCVTAHTAVPGTWSAVSAGMDRDIFALAVYDGELIAGGTFFTVDGNGLGFIAAWSGSGWHPLGTGLGAPVRALAAYGEDLVAGGSFIEAGEDTVNRIARWDGTSWHPLGSGMNGTVNALVEYNGDLIAAGQFTTAGGVPAGYIARWDGSQWHTMEPGFSEYVGALIVHQGSLYAAGSFMGGAGVGANSIARWNGANWFRLNPDPLEDATSLGVYQNDLILGGCFANIGSVPAHGIALWDGAHWQVLGSGLDGPPSAIVQFGNALIVGGMFTTAGDVAASRVARWDGTHWTPLGSGVNAAVSSLVLFEGDVIAAGSFTSAGGVAASRIARWSE